MENNEFDRERTEEELQSMARDSEETASEEDSADAPQDLEETVSEETVEIMEQQPAPPKLNWKKEVFEWAQALLIAVVVAVIIRNFFFTLVLVDGGSMENTLHTGDRLFVNRFGYSPERGDIVVFTPEKIPDKPFIKRVIAVEGQTVDIDFDRGIVMVDGKILDEPYIKVPTKRPGDVQFPAVVPDGHFFALGDNRGNSHDSRNSNVGSADNRDGMVRNESLMGKALFRVWPFNKIGSLY